MNGCRASVSLFLAVVAAGCAGPSPCSRVRHWSPSSPTAPFVVEAVVRNAGCGSGQVEVEAAIRERASGQVVARGEATTTLGAWEHQRVVLTLPRPPSSVDLSSEDVELRIAVQYPNRVSARQAGHR
jgi:hypothetical protein